MKRHLLLLILLLSNFYFAQNKVKIYFEKKQDSIIYYADNADIFPVTLVFAQRPETENMRQTEIFRANQVLEGSSTKTKIIGFVKNDKFKSATIKKMPSAKIFIGNATLTSYDAQYQYDLPFKKGFSYPVYQGYNGNFSHQNENAIDFTMPVNTEVLASREGKVIDVKQTSNSGCPTKDCVKMGNYISILHSDGTIAQYFHLKFNGAVVKPGDIVIKGDLIGYSGNTGWSSGPHLHFVCILPTANESGRKTIKTLFRTGDGTKSEYLVEKKTYSKNY